MGGWARSSYDDEDERFGRAFGHWTFSKDENYFDDLATTPVDISVLSLRRDDKNWDVLPSLDALEEVTAINPNKKQLATIYSCSGLKRLRLWDMRSATFEGLENLKLLEELACFSVSGPKSLKPVAALPRLKSLLIENMRSLKNWSDLSQAKSLQCLCMSGGFVEAKQEVHSLDFLEDVTALRHFHSNGIRCRGTFPALAGLALLPKLETVHLNSFDFSLDDNAYFEAIVSENKRLQKGLFGVIGWHDTKASSLKDAKSLPGPTLLFEPWVKSDNDQPFTRSFKGEREKVFERIKAFEKRYLEVQEQVVTC